MSISFRRRLWSVLPAVVFAGFITFSANEAHASEYQQPKEVHVVQQIQRYCATSWQNANIPRAEWPDCSQQVFAELLQRIPRGELAQSLAYSESEQRRELNRSIWRIVKRWTRRARHPSLDGFDTADPASLCGHRAQDEALAKVMQIAAEKLTPRQKQVVSLLCDGHSIGQISKHLDIPVQRVSDEKYRAIQKIRRHV